MNSWLFFALLAPLLWAFTNIFDGALRRHFIKSDFALTWIAAVSRLPFVIIFFWIGGFEIPALPVLLLMFLGGMLWTGPMALYFKAIEFEEPSRVALLLQMMPIFTLLIAYLLLGETLSTIQAIAFGILITAGVLAAIKQTGKGWHFSKAFVLVLIAGLLWAFSDVLFKKFELVFSNFFAAFAIYFFGSFLVSIFSMFNKKGRKSILSYFSNLPIRAWLMLIGSMLAGICGSISFAYALTLGKASLTAVIIGAQPLIVFILGLLFARFISEIRKEDTSKNALILKAISFGLVIVGLVVLEI